MTLDRRGFLAAAAGAALAACGVRRSGDDRSPAPNLSDARGSGGSGAASEGASAHDLADARGSGSAAPSEGADAAAPDPAAPDGEIELVVLCRDAWGARPAGAGLEEHTITGMMLHHTAVVLRDNSEAPARLRQHQRYHQESGWPDIAYHLGVDRDGTVYELRTTTARGDTFTDYEPAGWLLVTCEGNFDQQEPTSAQVDAAVRTFAWGAAAFGVEPRSVAAHRDHAATSCPGDALYALLPSIRQRGGELAGRVTRRDLCGEEAARRVAAIESGRSPD